MRAACRFDVNGGKTMRAILGRGRRRRLLHFAVATDQKENHEGDYQEAKNCIEKDTVIQCCSTRSLRCGNIG
jgi:hypothetical protein